MLSSSSSWRIKASGITAACAIILLTFWYHDSEAVCRIANGRRFCADRHQPPNPAPSSHLNSYSFKHRNIAIATTFGYHFDVWLPVAWTLQRIMRGVEGGAVQVYAQTPFAHGFGEISDNLGLYRGSIKDYEAIIADLRANEGDGGIDMVIFPTSIIDLRHYGKQLLEAWDARDEAHKFTVVALTHHAAEKDWMVLFAPLARRGALRLLTISDHVSRAFQELLREFADSSDPEFHSAGFQQVLVDTHVPILNISTSSTRSSGRLSNVAIQGSFSTDSRDFIRIFARLIQSLHEHPRMWGYHPSVDGSPFTEDTRVADPFKLHLVGHGWIDIPNELKNVIVFHAELKYHDFYNVMASMDLCLPAFRADDYYYNATASSTVVMCSQLNTPMLVTQRFRDAYTYLDDDRVLVTHPAVMSELDAIKAFRTQDASDFLASDPSKLGLTMGSNPGVRRAVENMLRQGWTRPTAGFEEWKRGVWANNDAAMVRILSDAR
ncbi:hypothetical protein FIBSPDRAFT_272137 [Athelia psychrophila]|uniref:Glycosyltransferase family 1 protein n=1 Tax=Athelia psychrophila TaxID=1759441 RepID=A0A165WTW1_9AGAM|nr:hypothetical protein FIBSPDRAFT_272137 [Fibularhizoctonia sp. CBS 109695]